LETAVQGFSALQRAENSSKDGEIAKALDEIGFSALQRAENSSKVHAWNKPDQPQVSVLFSEPKIPQTAAAEGINIFTACFSALQRAENSSKECFETDGRMTARVSVLFSEPKIPQSDLQVWMHPTGQRFSALQRAENSSNLQGN